MTPQGLLGILGATRKGWASIGIHTADGIGIQGQWEEQQLRQPTRLDGLFGWWGWQGLVGQGIFRFGGMDGGGQEPTQEEGDGWFKPDGQQEAGGLLIVFIMGVVLLEFVFFHLGADDLEQGKECGPGDGQAIGHGEGIAPGREDFAGIQGVAYPLIKPGQDQLSGFGQDRKRGSQLPHACHGNPFAYGHEGQAGGDLGRGVVPEGKPGRAIWELIEPEAEIELLKIVLIDQDDCQWPGCADQGQEDFLWTVSQSQSRFSDEISVQEQDKEAGNEQPSELSQQIPSQWQESSPCGWE